MDKEVCFCVEKKNLYLVQVLVEYKDIPIFFLCKNGGQYYVTLCTDMEVLNYIIIKASSSDVYNLLHGKIPMRNVFLKQKEYWNVISGEEISLDIVEKHRMDSLDSSLLPEENACFKILTEDMSVFVQEFDREFFDTEHFDVSEKQIVFDEMSMSSALEIDAAFQQFTNLGSYSFKSEIKQQSISAADLGGEYLLHIEKKVMLQKCDQLEDWKSDDSINVAA